MHAVKSRARRYAWKPSDDDAHNLNPFARAASRPSHAYDAEEATLSEPAGEASRRAHEVDEEAAPSQTEDDIRIVPQSHELYSQHPPPLGRSDSASVTLAQQPGDGLDAIVEEPAKLPSEASGSLADDSTAAVAAGPIRRRKFGGFRKKEDSMSLEGGDSKKEDSKKRLNTHITFVSQIRATVFGSWFNILFVFVPVGFASNYAGWGAVTTFCTNFVAIVPSNALLAYGIEEGMLRFGDVVGALLSISFSNAVQLISSIFLLRSGQIPVLQFSLLGCILQNLLLMTGLAFLFGGMRYQQQHFNAQVAQTTGMFLLLAVLSLVIPTASRLLSNTNTKSIILQSRGTSVVIIVSYGLYLFFQLKTHRAMFDQPAKKTPKAVSNKIEHGTVIKGIAAVGDTMAGHGRPVGESIMLELEEKPVDPQLTLVGAILTIAITTVLIGFNTQFATDSIQNLCTQRGLTQAFMGTVVLPLISNDPSLLWVARADKIDMCLSLTLERCMQISLLVLPLVVLLGWFMQIDNMTMDFDGFSIAALFSSIVIVTYVVQEGKSNWLTGALLLKVFVIIALATYFVGT